MTSIEWIKDGDEILSLIIRASLSPEKTSFVTPDAFIQQAGFVVYPQGGVIADHIHKPLQREIVGTPETLLVRKGRMVARFFSNSRELRCEAVVETGDILMLVSGGHGFTMLEDTVLFEIKQGPYTGLIEKERF